MPALLCDKGKLDYEGNTVTGIVRRHGELLLDGAVFLDVGGAGHVPIWGSGEPLLLLQYLPNGDPHGKPLREIVAVHSNRLAAKVVQLNSGRGSLKLGVTHWNFHLVGQLEIENANFLHFEGGMLDRPVSSGPTHHVDTDQRLRGRVGLQDRSNAVDCPPGVVVTPLRPRPRPELGVTLVAGGRGRGGGRGEGPEVGSQGRGTMGPRFHVPKPGAGAGSPERPDRIQPISRPPIPGPRPPTPDPLPVPRSADPDSGNGGLGASGFTVALLSSPGAEGALAQGDLGVVSNRPGHPSTIPAGAIRGRRRRRDGQR